MTCDSVAVTAEQEPVPFYNAEDAKPAGEKRTQKWGCMLKAARLSRFFGSACHSGAALGSSRSCQPCWGQTGMAWHARACWVPQCPVPAGSLLDTAVRCFWLPLNTCSHKCLTIRLHLKRSLHPLRFCYSELLATFTRVMYLGNVLNTVIFNFFFSPEIACVHHNRGISVLIKQNTGFLLWSISRHPNVLQSSLYFPGQNEECCCVNIMIFALLLNFLIDKLYLLLFQH